MHTSRIRKSQACSSCWRHKFARTLRFTHQNTMKNFRCAVNLPFPPFWEGASQGFNYFLYFIFLVSSIFPKCRLFSACLSLTFGVCWRRRPICQNMTRCAWIWSSHTHTHRHTHTHTHTHTHSPLLSFPSLVHTHTHSWWAQPWASSRPSRSAKATRRSSTTLRSCPASVRR